MEIFQSLHEAKIKLDPRISLTLITIFATVPEQLELLWAFMARRAHGEILIAFIRNLSKEKAIEALTLKLNEKQVRDAERILQCSVSIFNITKNPEDKI